MRGTSITALRGLKRPDLLRGSAYVKGAWFSKPDTLSVFDPANGDELAEVAACGDSDVDDAVNFARAAFLQWREMLPSQHGALPFGSSNGELKIVPRGWTPQVLERITRRFTGGSWGALGAWG
nr:aldehyde dehydrogenase family protein [Phyllobacterium sophorae]